MRPIKLMRKVNLPGFQTVLGTQNAKLTITVLDETKEIGGITARVVEEREGKQRWTRDNIPRPTTIRAIVLKSAKGSPSDDC